MKKFLFTTLISNDLGLLARSLPIARELGERGHHVAFCSPAKAPSKLISQAGFDNVIPKWPLLNIMTGDISFPNILRIFQSKEAMRDLSIFVSFVRQVKRSATAEIWNIDQFTHLLMWNQSSARALVQSMMRAMEDYGPDVVVDFWNPWACIAARAFDKPLVTVIQSDMHPGSGGFIWWKEPPPGLLSALPFVNTVLTENGLEPVSGTGELFLGDMTLVVGMPETDPLPETAAVTYLGPVLWQNPDGKLPDWAGDLAEDRPVIWLDAGNPQYNKRSSTHLGPTGSPAIKCLCNRSRTGKAVRALRTDGRIFRFRANPAHGPIPKL